MVDFTVRSLIVAAHTIKSEGLFNLKIAGRMPGYSNHFRIGVVKGEPLLRNILDKGVRTITQDERDLVANRHAGITFGVQVDYRMVWEVSVVAFLVVVGLLLRQRQIRRFDAARMEDARRKLEFERHAREEQSRLVAMLSHEVKTPLAIIDGAAQSLALLLADATPEVERRIDRIRRGVGRLDSLTHQFLDKDRLEVESIRAQSVAFDLGVLITEVVADLGHKQRVIVTETPERAVHGDPGLVQLAARNLIHNALKYSPPETRVWISAKCEGGRVQVCVRDEGPGVESSLRDSVFGSYVRGNHGDKVPGAGLGLYLVGRIAKLHGGEARLTDWPEGAEFVVEWLDDGA